MSIKLNNKPYDALGFKAGDEVVILKNDSCCFEVGQVGTYTGLDDGGEGWLWVESCGTEQLVRPDQVLKIALKLNITWGESPKGIKL